MAYGLRYTISQILRNGNTQTIELWQKDYTAGIVKTYKPTSIILQPNSSEEYPYPTILSSELRFGIILETEDDYTQFPNVLTQDNRKYYVILKESSTIMWKGFLFNDYSQIGFSTGINEADFLAIDGLSYIETIEYVPDDSINQLTRHIDIINTALSLLQYPFTSNLVVACSYFASGMVNRTNNVQNEPFSQIYQYRRDYLGQSYYTILENIMRSFNCRLFQANGDWWICSINEMAAPVNYYTKYSLPTLSITSSGVLSNQINIEPYASNNVHFVNNSQIKLFKKGFYNIQGRGNYNSALNYVHNANLKENNATNATGWIRSQSGTATATLIVNADEQFDEFFITRGASGSASVETGNTILPFNYYLPLSVDDGYKLSFDHKTFVSTKVQIQFMTSISIIKYLDSNDVWQSTPQFLSLSDTNGSFQSKSFDIPPYEDVTGFVTGYIKIVFLVDTSGQASNLRNFILTQADRDVKTIEANYNIDSLENSTLKVFEQPYGNNYPTLTQYSNNIGVLCNSVGQFLYNWYSSTNPGSAQSGAIDLIVFMTYQNIRNVNKNIATVEGDLGAFKSSTGYVYLDKVFTTTDTTTGNLSYTGKKFIINRLTQNAYIDETNSIQLIEVDNSSEIYGPFFFIVPNYISDKGILGPFWNLKLNIF